MTSVKNYLETFKMEVLPHPPHSPDIARFNEHMKIPKIRYSLNVKVFFLVRYLYTVRKIGKKVVSDGKHFE